MTRSKGTKPKARKPRWRVEHADCVHALARLDAASIDAVITDPPYGINLGGIAWDGKAIADAARSDLALREKLGTPGRTRGGSAFGSPSSYAGAYDFSPRGMQAFQAFSARWGAGCLRVINPGGHLAAFASPRTAHRLACGLEEAGFELRDVLMWLQGQGFPKSQPLPRHAGWGTALKPAYEPIILARKPLVGTTEQNLDRHGTGALHIDPCRTGEPPCAGGARRHPGGGARCASEAGRWPANVCLSHARSCAPERCTEDCPVGRLAGRARFFYCPKTSRRERDAGCERLARRTIQTFKIGAEDEHRASRHPVANIHPTVKPIELMRWLVRLLTPPGGLVLDPFTGSGSTGAAAVLEGARFHGIEREADYIPIARARVAHWAGRADHRGENRRRDSDCPFAPSARRQR